MNSSAQLENRRTFYSVPKALADYARAFLQEFKKKFNRELC